jgi:hypothetical protein
LRGLYCAATGKELKVSWSMPIVSWKNEQGSNWERIESQGLEALEELACRCKQQLGKN